MLEILKKVGNSFDNCFTIADITDPMHPLIFVNQQFEKVTGYHADEVIGKNCKFLQSRFPDEKKINYMQKTFKEREACVVDLINYRKDGEAFWNRLVLFPLKYRNTTYYVGLQQDLSAIKKKQFSTKDVRDIKSSEICHHINNPLTVILSLTRQLDKNLTIEERNEIQDKIRNGLSRLNHFLVNIQEISEFDSFEY